MSQQGSINPFYKSREWLALRFRTLHRDGWRCVMCGASLKGKGNSRVDHIQTIIDRPDLKLDPNNVRSLCPACDNRRHSEKYTKVRDVAQVNVDGTPAGWFDGVMPEIQR